MKKRKDDKTEQRDVADLLRATPKRRCRLRSRRRLGGAKQENPPQTHPMPPANPHTPKRQTATASLGGGTKLGRLLANGLRNPAGHEGRRLEPEVWSLKPYGLIH
jgi:hypothetical protein